MLQHFGHQHWWPGDTPFEVCVGAILTQNTNWGNVERAIANLKSAGVLEPVRLYGLAEADLAELIRPAGYFNVKARRLRSFRRVLVEDHGGNLESLMGSDTAATRRRLLAIHGIGEETADSMLLYAGGHCSFVIDAYTRRIFLRHGWSEAEASYGDLQQTIEAGLREKPDTLNYWQDYHAQVVMVGKHFCRPRNPDCAACPLKPLLPASGPPGHLVA